MSVYICWKMNKYWFQSFPIYLQRPKKSFWITIWLNDWIVMKWMRYMQRSIPALPSAFSQSLCLTLNLFPPESSNIKYITIQIESIVYTEISVNPKSGCNCVCIIDLKTVYFVPWYNTQYAYNIIVIIITIIKKQWSKYPWIFYAVS